MTAWLQLQRGGLGRVQRALRYQLAAIEGAVQRLRSKLMTVTAVLASLIPILFETGIGSDVMKPIAPPIVGGMITSMIHVLILVPVYFVMMKERRCRGASYTLSLGRILDSSPLLSYRQ
jgi:Cu(I)/Ag(I) efflux system membrane protein CusA/SilA